MIKVSKLHVSNFKGIRSDLTINFDNKDQFVSVLSGPNGFGKTTIFDALDICITGQLYRYSEKQLFDGVQKNQIGRNKPYYQNEDGVDVMLKVLLTDTLNQKSYVIVKHYDDNVGLNQVSARRANIPSDSNNFFVTYLSENPEDFYNNDVLNQTPVNQSKIDEIFLGENSIVTLGSIFYLFNYLQQEDNIYFLRRDEDEKGEELSFLFNIVKEQEEKDKLEEVLNHLTSQYSTITLEIEKLEQSYVKTESVEYVRLFEDKEFKFDTQEPFDDVEDKKAAYDFYIKQLSDLIEFKNSFNTIEYQKHKDYNFLRNKVLDKRDLIESLMVKDLYSEEQIEKITERNEKIKKLKAIIDSEKIEIVDPDIFSWLYEKDTEEKLREYLIDTKALSDINQDLGVIGKIISELLVQREKAVLEFENLIKKEVIDSTKCPLCDSPFKGYNELIKAIEAKTKELESYNASKLELKKAAQKKVDDRIIEIKDLSKKYIEKHPPIDEYIADRLKQFPNYKVQVEEIFEKFPSLAIDPFLDFYFTKLPFSKDDFLEKVLEFEKSISDKLFTNYQYDESSIQNKELFTSYFDEDKDRFDRLSQEMISNKRKYITTMFSISVNENLTFLKERQKILNIMVIKTRSLRDDIHTTIQEYKKEMIEKIKVPFYIYSGKILQSYQQGLGIFINIRETDSKRNKIVFKTGAYSDHDIVYHLSSGQMAVASIAFCLALNKVYNTNENFKFLAIDDPIQTMDDLNVHTFIELIRHEFRDYQIIISTHDDFTSKYIKYKFDKVGYKTEIKNIQQEVMAQLNN